ncbi:acyl-CoA dehydrogenase [Mycobacterium sp. NAZ190054]|uniref:acyl-CoA dehydrogenase n=1 Tax=Mycobacterium sp. NAZ190054 TaxID=1747766 RepID=UPI00079ABDE2|nr:acyl-CoA dehydrogenase [Mycobacterium sp. NAZ190054]KWX69253.1 acyl-CoA dehydrogenase [Mycobacterium sp. NAZ190054]
MPELISRRDLDFLLYEWLDVESLTERQRFAAHSRETFDAVLDLSTDIAEQCFAPHNKKADANEPIMRPDGSVELIDEIAEALRVYQSAGLTAGTFDDDLGGMQLPVTIGRASMMWLQAANVGTANYPFLTIANAQLLAKYGTADQVRHYVVPMVEGRYYGTMCLSEPQAGSSLADITTKAVPQGDGSYRITGTKMWISCGEHDLGENIVHLVLAKSPGGGPGVKGISLFVVPKFLPGEDGIGLGERNDVTLMGLNHKMGVRGTTNTLLAFGDGTHQPGGRGGAVGYLVGQEHAGLSCMFHMMNDARIGIGFIATALGYVSYLKSLDYAKVRTQGRPPGAKDPSASALPLTEHADVRRMLLAQKSYVEGSLALALYCARLVDEQVTGNPESIREASALLDVLTPVVKSWPSEWCLKANDLAIQIYGGYGYTRDYDVEQHYRDNRLNRIHEGTNGIQAIDLLGRKVTLDSGYGWTTLLARVENTVDRGQSAGGDAALHAATLRTAWSTLAEVTTELLAEPDARLRLANASIYLDAVGMAVTAWMWLEQLLAAEGGTDDFYEGKRRAAEYFFTYELPQINSHIGVLRAGGQLLLDTTPECL